MRFSVFATALAIVCSSATAPALAQAPAAPGDKQLTPLAKQAEIRKQGDQRSRAPTRAVKLAPTYERMPPGAEMNIRIQFDFDSAILRPDQFQLLDDLCAELQDNDMYGHSLNVMGHTDETGSADHNLNLSRQRAEAVRRHLIQDCGLPARRLQSVGWGEQHLLPEEDSRSPSQRRVEFQLGG